MRYWLQSAFADQFAGAADKRHRIFFGFPFLFPKVLPSYSSETQRLKVRYTAAALPRLPAGKLFGRLRKWSRYGFVKLILFVRNPILRTSVSSPALGCGFRCGYGCAKRPLTPSAPYSIYPHTGPGQGQGTSQTKELGSRKFLAGQCPDAR